MLGLRLDEPLAARRASRARSTASALARLRAARPRASGDGDGADARADPARALLGGGVTAELLA